MDSRLGDVPQTDWRALVRGGRMMRILPIVALAVFGTLFVHHLWGMDGGAVLRSMSSLSIWQWVCALIFTGFSFCALGQYDVLVHRVLGTGQSAYAARAAGVKAIALSQTLGFGAITGALVRWRCLPDMAPAQILRLSVVVSLSFLAALAAITAIVVPVSGLVPRSGGMLMLGLVAIVALIVLARLAHRLGWIPNAVTLKTLIALLVATAADTLFAALALWILWPDTLSFQMLFAAYLVALGAGLLSNAPGGVGAFDLALLAVLGASNNEQAMAALLAFRIIYYAIPAGLAVLGLFNIRPYTLSANLDHPEVGLIHQTATRFSHAKGALLTLPCIGAGAVLGDLPAGMSTADLRRRTDPRALYKCSARQAISARAGGWAVLRCAQDAWINPQTWTQDGPALRQLRRALAQFRRSGLTIAEVEEPLTLADVARKWAVDHGGERGHSMGRFCPKYLSRQRVFAAYDGDTPVAFVSFHTGANWTLDLMRHTRTAPKGVMHALVNAAIAAAKTTHVHRLSLASVADPDDRFAFAHRIKTSQSGLHRFKAAFAPRWVPLYICASGRTRLMVTILTLAIQIKWPAPLPVRADHPSRARRANPNSVQPKHEDFSVAPQRLACEPLSALAGDAYNDQRPFRPARNA